MSSVTFFSYFNPCSSLSKCVKDFRKLHKEQMITVLGLSALAAIGTAFIFGIAGLAVFRKSVEFFYSKNEQKEACVFSKTISQKSLKREGPIFTTEIPDGDNILIPGNQLLSNIKHKIKSDASFSKAQKKNILRELSKLLKMGITGKEFIKLEPHFSANAKTLKLSPKLCKAALLIILNSFDEILLKKMNNQFVKELEVPKTSLNSLLNYIGKIQSPWKKAIYSNAIHLFEYHQCQCQLRIFSKKKELNYIKAPYRKSQDIKIGFRKGCYQYSASQSGHYYVISLTDRKEELLQDDLMLAEMPNLANFFSSTKSGFSRPLLFENATRVQQVNAYGKVPEAIDLKDILEQLEKPQNVAVLEMGAAKCARFSLNDAFSLFNTICAGFSLAKDSSSASHVTIHSGGLGYGTFSNNWRASILLQLLAAQYLHVNVVLHQINRLQKKEIMDVWDTIQPYLHGKSLEECIKLLVGILK